MSDRRNTEPMRVWLVSELGPGPGEWVEGCYTSRAAAEVHAGKRVAEWALEKHGNKPQMCVYDVLVHRSPDDDD